MLAVTQKLMAVILLGVALATTGCCCCGSNNCGGGNSCGGGACCGCGCCNLFMRRSVADDYMGGGSYWPGCGCSCEKYYGDWHSYPCCPDPCDCCGNYAGSHETGPGYQLPPRVSAGYGRPATYYRARNGQLPESPDAPTPAAPMTPAPTAPPGSPTLAPESLPTSGEEENVSYQQPVDQQWKPKKHCATCGT